MKIQGIQNQTSFSGNVIVVGERSAKQLHQFAKQFNEMNIVKNSPYNIYIANGPNTKFWGLPARVFATRGKYKDKCDIVFKGEKSILNAEGMKGAIFRAIKNAENREKVTNEGVKENGLKIYLNGIANKLNKIFPNGEEA